MPAAKNICIKIQFFPNQASGTLKVYLQGVDFGLRPSFIPVLDKNAI
jgi:hypothetical protein